MKLVCFVRGMVFNGTKVKNAEPMVWKFFSENIQKGWRCVDVGANRGEYSFLMAEVVGPSGFVYAFELHPENVRVLKYNLWRYRQSVKVEPLAVTDGKSEIVEVFPGRRRSGAEWNIIGSSLTGENTPPEFSVKTTLLDDYFPPRKTIDLVKIDVEGSAEGVLVGMRRILSESRPLLVIEFHNESEWQARQHLEDAEYRFVDFKGQIIEETGHFTFQCLAIPTHQFSKMFPGPF